MNFLCSTFRSFVLHQRTILSIVPLTHRCQLYSKASNSFVSITKDVTGSVAIMKLEKTPVNSLNLEMIEQISSSVKEMEKQSFKGFIFTSGLPSVFSAGLDLMEMVEFEESRLRAFYKSFQELFKTLYLTPLATVAAINGHAPAAGCMLALTCDIRIMIDRKATIGMTGTRLGIAVPEWFRSLLLNNIGFRQAEKALILGSHFSPQEALALNLVDDLASSPEELQQKALYNIGLLTKIPESARQMTKIGLRKKFVEEMNLYADKELEDFVEFLRQEQTQQMLKMHIEKLKTKKMNFL